MIEEKIARRTCSIEEAAKALGVCKSVAYAAARTGELPTIRLGKRVLVLREALEKKLAGAA